jgi:flagellar biosynthetic protein FlhB
MSEGAEKTEQATEQQIQKFRREGKVATSKELLAAIGLAASAFAMFQAVPYIGAGLLHLARDSFARGATREFVAADVMTLLLRTMTSLGPGILLALTPGIVAAIGVGLVLTGFNLSSEAITPDLSRLDPLGAAKSMFFSSSPWVSLAKAAAVATLLIWAVYSSLIDHMASLPVAGSWPVGAQLGFIEVLTKAVLTRALPVALAVGAADFAWQRYHLSEQMMMTRQDVRQENKDTEGDPQIRARRRQRARQLAMGRQLANVVKADVIVANPTHFAVALRYRKEENASPVVLARGLDNIALKIRAEAGRHDIPVIENRTLARALYARSKVGAPIPSEFFGPVAQVLALVYRRRHKR